MLSIFLSVKITFNRNESALFLVSIFVFTYTSLMVYNIKKITGGESIWEKCYEYYGI